MDEICEARCGAWCERLLRGLLIGMVMVLALVALTIWAASARS